MGTIPNYSDILAYKPNLEPTRTVQSTLATNEYYSGPVLASNSNTLLQLSNYRPSYVIGSLNRTITDVGVMTDMLGNLIPSATLNPIKQALVSCDNVTADGLLKQHSSDINSDTNIEIYGQLYKLKNEMQGFNSLYTKINYGDGVSVANASSQDESMINTLMAYETDATKTQYINYGALNIDVQLNKLASAHVDTLNGYANQLYAMTVDTSNPSDSMTTSISFKPMITSFFNDAVDGNNNDSVKLDSLVNSGTINSTLYSAYNKRKDMVVSIKSTGDIDNVLDDGLLSTLHTYLGKSITNAYNSISDLQKVVNMSAMCRDSYLNSLQTKEDLRNIYNLS